MNPKIISIIAFLVAVAGVLFLFTMDYIFSLLPIPIFIQVFSIGLMIWARFTFGLRSFHAAANTTKGELVTNGPYRWLRHPIYASLIYFFSASVIAYPFIETVIGFIMIVVGLYIRMIMEEKYLIERYKEYAEYSKNTKRIIPYLF